MTAACHVSPQNWTGMSAAEAFLIIERNAGSWDEAGSMMEAWVLANRDTIAQSKPDTQPTRFFARWWPRPEQFDIMPPGYEFTPIPPPYILNLADLMLFADMACELDGLKNLPAIAPDTRDRLAQMVHAAHDVVQRAAGTDARLIYSSDEVEAQPETEPCHA
jgi:hypothetical protein